MITKNKRKEKMKAKNIWEILRNKRKIILTISVILGLVAIIIEIIPIIISINKADIISLSCYISSYILIYLSEELAKPVHRLKQINEIYENNCTEEQKEQVFKLMMNFKEENEKISKEIKAGKA